MSAMFIKISRIILMVFLAEAQGVEYSSTPLPHPPAPPDIIYTHHPTVKPMNEEEILLECLELGLAIDPNRGRLSVFNATGTMQCWLYCKYTFKCFVAKFQSVHGSCSLFANNYIYAINVLDNPNFVVRKQCMEKRPTQKLLAAAVPNPGPGPNFLIQQPDPYTGCLTKGQLETSHLDGNSSYRLIWKLCTNTTSWSLRKVEHQSSKIQDQDFFQIYLADEPDMCLDAYFLTAGTIGKMQGILTKCRDITISDQEDSQIMFLRTEKQLLQSEYTDLLSIYSISGVLDDVYVRLLFPRPGGDFSRPLTGLIFTDLSTQFYQTECHLSQFNINHGAVENIDAPFFLPGEEIRVLCEPGFGVSSLNYSSLQILVCGEDENVQPCSRMLGKEGRRRKEREQGSVDRRCYLFLVFGIVGFAVAFFELVVILKNRGEACKNEVSGTDDCDDIAKASVTAAKTSSNGNPV